MSEGRAGAMTPTATPQGLASPGRFGHVPTADRIAAAREVADAYRLGSAALSAVLGPACCLVFERDEYRQLILAYRLDAPERPAPKTAPLVIGEQIQGWWLATVQASGPPRAARPVELPGKPRSFVIPLVASETLHGIVVLQECRLALDAEAERELLALATTLSLTLSALSLRGQLAQAVLPEQVEEAITQERRRIAREIHDGVAQSLAYLNLKTELLDRLVERNPAAAREQAGVVRQLLQTAMGDLRRCIGDLRRPAPGHGPAITAQLRTLASTLPEMPNLELALQEVSGKRLAPEVERSVIGIVREALHNIRKHAAANSVRVEVTREDDALRVLVTDDGKGFRVADRPGEAGGHFGLVQIRELAQELGGDVAITSQPGVGTRIEALIPVREVSDGTAPGKARAG